MTRRAEAAKDFDSAIRFYEQSAKKSHSANLYGNLANLYFKKEMFGRSILNYRKALLLAPENRDFTANLAFVRETARIQGSSLDKQSSYFYFDVGPSSINAWTVFTAIIFWGGMGAMGLIFFWQFDRILQVILFLFWIGLNFFGALAVTKAKNNFDLQNREVIAIASSTGEDSNASNLIYLRVSAFEGSATNTSVLPGESLFWRRREPIGRGWCSQKHKNAIGEVWYFVRSLEGRNKGWIREDQFERIVAPKPAEIEANQGPQINRVSSIFSIATKSPLNFSSMIFLIPSGNSEILFSIILESLI